MKYLSREEMKKVMGGNEVWHAAKVYCNDGWTTNSDNECSNSVGVCNGHGGFDKCTGSYYA